MVRALLVTRQRDRHPRIVQSSRAFKNTALNKLGGVYARGTSSGAEIRTTHVLLVLMNPNASWSRIGRETKKDGRTVKRHFMAWATSGSCSPGVSGLPFDNAAHTIMNPLNRARLLLDIAERPAAYHRERVEMFWFRWGVRVSEKQISDAMRTVIFLDRGTASVSDSAASQENITRKKMLRWAAVKQTAAIALWIRVFLLLRVPIHVDNVVVIDESGWKKSGVCALACRGGRCRDDRVLLQTDRAFGYAPSGQRATEAGAVKGHGSRFNFLCAMASDGMLPCSFGFIGNCNWCAAFTWVLHGLG